MIPLTETRTDGLRVALPAGRSAAAWHRALVAEITQHLSAAHAHVLGRPEPTANGLLWTTEGATAARYAELPAASRRAIDVALGAILSDIRRLAESGRAPEVRQAWPALREIPDLGHLFAVDGRPVLAAWGHVGDAAAGRLTAFDDGVPWRGVPRTPWARYGATLAALAALGLIAGLLLPVTASHLLARPLACPIIPGQMEAWREQTALENRGQQLQALLATLTEETGRRELMCPIAVLPQASAPLPPPRAELPQDRWNQRDLSMLKGCWSLYTDLKLIHGQDAPVKISSWRLCFDDHGTGTQAIVLEDGRGCEGPLAATFDQDQALRVTKPAACTGTLQVARTDLVCHRISESEAQCGGSNTERSPAAIDYTGQFRR